jgi:hypothetical protein
MLILCRRDEDRSRSRHCEERSDEAIQRIPEAVLDCFATLAMTMMRFHPSPPFAKFMAAA